MLQHEENRRVQHTTKDPEYTHLNLTDKAIIIIKSCGPGWYSAVSTFNLLRERQFILPVNLP